MVLAQCNLDHVLTCQATLHGRVAEARILVAQSKPASAPYATDVEIRHRIGRQDRTVQFRENSISDQKGSAEYESRDFRDV